MRLALDGVVKAFGAQCVLDCVTWQACFEHTLALIGPSGGGKSTLLRLLAGLDTADAGRVVVDGVELPSDEAGLRTHRQGTGIVFQSFNLFPHLTALENIVLPLVHVHGVARPEAMERAASLLERFRLSDHGHKQPALLSGGQRQRVAIARALAHHPGLLLLDEPTSALDPEMTSEVLDLIAELRDSGQRIILVTHEMGFARHTADLVAFIDKGGILESGNAEDFFESPRQPETRRFLEKILKY
jgi:polar amino acid transport system ATP-binding protein